MLHYCFCFYIKIFNYIVKESTVNQGYECQSDAIILLIMSSLARVVHFTNLMN